MIGPIIVSAVAFLIVATYILSVNWFLRQDEHYNEEQDWKPVLAKEQPATMAAVPAHA